MSGQSAEEKSAKMAPIRVGASPGRESLPPPRQDAKQSTHWPVRLCIGVKLQGLHKCTLVAGQHDAYHVNARGGQAQLFFSPQSQFRNLKEALPQSQFGNFLRNVAPQLQLCNSAIAIFSEVGNFKTAT
jgi:hypothetical protein